jgi:hypothetical protein
VATSDPSSSAWRRDAEHAPQTLRSTSARARAAGPHHRQHAALPDAEIERLRLIKVLVEDAGVNLAGVQRLLAVAVGLQRLEPLLDDPGIGRADGRRRLAREVQRLKDVVGL